jgi:hypothetical protein
VVPITAVEAGPDTYEYVNGLLRMLALESLGHTHVPAFVLDAADEEVLLRVAISEQEAQVPLSLLERGWALQRLHRMRAAAGRPATQAQVAVECGLDKGDVSMLLRAASAIPAERAVEMARAHGLAVQDIASLPREVLRLLCRAPAGQQDSLFHAACAALASGGSPARAVRTARAAAAADGAANAPAEGEPRTPWTDVTLRIFAVLRQTLDWFRHNFRGGWRVRWAARKSPGA